MTEGKYAVDAKSIAETISAVRARPDLAHVSFRIDSKWMGGLRGRSTTGEFIQAGVADATRAGAFTLDSDEPAALLGEDTAVSPGEYVLQALAACYAVTFAANAAVREITLDELELEFVGDFDLHGFFGLDEAIRPGMQELRVSARIKSPNASRDELEELVRAVEQRSPIRDTIANPVTVTTRLVS